MLTEDSRRANFTNEGGVDGTDPLPAQRDGPVAAAGVRCATWGGRAATWPGCSPTAAARAGAAAGRRPRRPASPAAGRHAGPDRRRLPRRRAAGAAGDPAEMVRCILDSLALAYRRAVARRPPSWPAGTRRRRARRRRRRPQRAAVPAHRRRLRPAGAGRARSRRPRWATCWCRPAPLGRGPAATWRRCGPASARRTRPARYEPGGAAAGWAGRASRLGAWQVSRCGSRCSSPASTTRCSRTPARRPSRLLRAAGPRGRLPGGADLLRPDAVNTGYLRRGGAAGPAPSSRPSRRTTRSSRRPGRASARCATSTRWSRGAPATPGWRPRAAALAARTYELSEFLVDVLGVTDVGAYFPHRVTYHPTCHSLRLLRRRRPAAAAAARRARPGAGRAARRRAVLRLRRHVRDEERRHLDRDAAPTRCATCCRHRRRGAARPATPPA